MQDSAPMLCECCDGKGELECSWCHGTGEMGGGAMHDSPTGRTWAQPPPLTMSNTPLPGVMTLGDTLYCSDGGCSLCIICKGQVGSLPVGFEHGRASLWPHEGFTRNASTLCRTRCSWRCSCSCWPCLPSQQGACTCKRCRGTGRRAAWLPPLPGCPVE